MPLIEKKPKSVGGIFAFFKDIFTHKSSQINSKKKYGVAEPIINEQTYGVSELKIKDDKLYISAYPNWINDICSTLKSDLRWHIRDLIENGEKNARGEKYKNITDVEDDNRTINYKEIDNNTIEVSGDIEFAIKCLKANHFCSEDIVVNRSSSAISTAFKPG